MNDSISQLISKGAQDDELKSIITSSAYTYRWYNCDDNTTLQESQVPTYTTSTFGSYGLEVKYGDCILVSDCFELKDDENPDVSVEDMPKADFMMYPNPTAGEVFLQFNTTLTDATVEVVDMVGRVMATKSVASAENINLQIDGDADIYLIRVKSSDGEIVKKIIRK